MNLQVRVSPTAASARDVHHSDAALEFGRAKQARWSVDALWLRSVRSVVAFLEGAQQARAHALTTESQTEMSNTKAD